MAEFKHKGQGGEHHKGEHQKETKHGQGGGGHQHKAGEECPACGGGRGGKKETHERHGQKEEKKA